MKKKEHNINIDIYAYEFNKLLRSNYDNNNIIDNLIQENRDNPDYWNNGNYKGILDAIQEHYKDIGKIKHFTLKDEISLNRNYFNTLLTEVNHKIFLNFTDDDKPLAFFLSNQGLINTCYNNFMVALAEKSKEQPLSPLLKGSLALHCAIFLGDESDEPINATFMDFTKERDLALHYMKNGGVLPELENESISLLNRVDKNFFEKLKAHSNTNKMNEELKDIVEHKDNNQVKQHKRKM